MSLLPTDAATRKATPIARGFLDYFPLAIAAVAQCSLAAGEQHYPGEPLGWRKEKSTDDADALLRHLIERGTIDSDGIRHTTKVAWRAMALLQRELEKASAGDPKKLVEDFLVANPEFRSPTPPPCRCPAWCNLHHGLAGVPLITA